MKSIWKDTAKLPVREPLKGELHTDVLIIGGGMAGILCAYMLKQKGVDCVVAERSTVGGGVTGNTTAKITSQHGFLYEKLTKRFGSEKAGLYLQANQEAVKAYQKLCQGIDCDFEEKPAFAYAAEDEKMLWKELEALERLGFPARYAQNLSLPFPIKGAVCFEGQAQFHPLKFLKEISKELTVYENTKVLFVEGNRGVTEQGTIQAEHIVVATHFPFLNRHGMYFMKLYQYRSYVMALEGAEDVGGMYIGLEKDTLSLRNYGNYLLIGGIGHPAGKKGEGFSKLEQEKARFYPESRGKYRFGAQDCIPLDDMPYIGLYSKHTPHLYAITGFQKWGMTLSMVGAKLISALILGEHSPYEALFSPSRSMIRPRLFANGIRTAAGLLTPTVPRCPHMGCALKWNPEEKTWDCPCHGSRFTEKGELLDNPSVKDLTV